MGSRQHKPPGGGELARGQQSVMVRSVDPTQSRVAWRFIGTAIPFE